MKHFKNRRLRCELWLTDDLTVAAFDISQVHENDLVKAGDWANKIIKKEINKNLYWQCYIAVVISFALTALIIALWTNK